jgi:hypothetical protein
MLSAGSWILSILIFFVPFGVVLVRVRVGGIEVRPPLGDLGRALMTPPAYTFPLSCSGDIMGAEDLAAQHAKGPGVPS